MRTNRETKQRKTQWHTNANCCSLRTEIQAQKYSARISCAGARLLLTVSDSVCASKFHIMKVFADFFFLVGVLFGHKHVAYFLHDSRHMQARRSTSTFDFSAAVIFAQNATFCARSRFIRESCLCIAPANEWVMLMGSRIVPKRHRTF